MPMIIDRQNTLIHRLIWIYTEVQECWAFEAYWKALPSWC